MLKISSSSQTVTVKKLPNAPAYDGHCLRAYSYFKDQMSDIDPSSVESINSIEDKYPLLRQESKGPTFA